MNWASEHEIPDAQKASHAGVKYDNISTTYEKCGNCRNFIPPKSCRTVKSPVSASGWCVRYKEKK